MKTEIHKYTSIDTQYYYRERNAPSLYSLLKDLPVGPTLELRIGAQVMLVANLNVVEGLVNGSRGLVTGFVSTEESICLTKEKASIRGTNVDDDVKQIQNFANKRQTRFPKVLFETENGTREVRFHIILLFLFHVDERLLLHRTYGR